MSVRPDFFLIYICYFQVDANYFDADVLFMKIK
jgi:hypothetical protein